MTMTFQNLFTQESNNIYYDRDRQPILLIFVKKKTIVIPFIYDAFHTKFGTELILYTIFLQISTQSVFRCVVGQIEEKQ